MLDQGTCRMRNKITAALLVCLLPFLSTAAQAELVLTIDNYTADELAFSISGTFDSDTSGEQPGYLAIKNDWSNNVGSHTEIWSATPTITSNTIQINGATPETGIGNNPTLGWADALYFVNRSTPWTGNGDPFEAGWAVTGSVVLSGVGAFDPSDAATLELVSGYKTTTRSWDRIEATAVAAVPIPAAAWLFGSGLVGLVGLRRRQRS
jgi:hypothetical protein